MQSLFAVKTRKKERKSISSSSQDTVAFAAGFASERAEIASGRPHRLEKLAVRNQKQQKP
jgi:hypothetical protein